MFERHEIEALVVGVRLVEAWCGPGLAASARSALARIRGVVTPELIEGVDDARVYAPQFGRTRGRQHFEVAHRGIAERRRLAIGYADEEGTVTARAVRPLGLYFWGKVWTLVAWCELRNDFRSFRLDRIHGPVLDEPFEHEPGKTLDVFMERFGPGA
jgi:predicted DNA-binding transcriptional regulator YafY